MNINFTAALTTQDAALLCAQRQFHLIILRLCDSDPYSEFLIAVRRTTYAPIIALFDVDDMDILCRALQSGADFCAATRWPVDLTAGHIQAQFRRYTDYDCHRDQKKKDFEIGDFYIDLARCVVQVQGQNVRLRPREFSLLHYFMKHPDEVLSAERICENVWNMDAGYDRGISQPIRILRKAIEPDPENPRYIHTVYRMGYRFTPNFVETCDEC